MNEEKLFYSGIYFQDGQNLSDSKEISYEIRMDIDNTPVTVENRNKFWFPGPDSSFDLDLRYHRGFIELQYAVDAAIIKYRKKVKARRERHNKAINEENNKNDSDNLGSSEVTEASNDSLFDSFFENYGSNHSQSDDTEKVTVKFEDDVEDFLDFKDDKEEQLTTTTSSYVTAETETEAEIAEEPGVSRRKKRSPQFEGLLSSIFSKLSSAMSDDDDSEEDDEIEIESLHVYTKEFPYPKYRADDFKKGLYLGQTVQMAFFLGLIVQISSTVRHRIWMKESGNRRVS